MSELTESPIQRNAIEEGAGDGSDGMVVNEEKTRLRAWTQIEPRLRFQTRIENRAARHRDTNTHRMLPQRTKMLFLAENYHRKLLPSAARGALINSERDANCGPSR
jgi:hypothetical protein